MSMNVLVADSDKGTSAALIDILKGIDCKSTHIHSDMLLDVVYDQSFDVAFIDLAAPGINAPRLVEILTTTDHRPSMIAYCRVSRKADLIYAIRSGFMDWIDKPAEAKEIITVIERVSRGSVDRALIEVPRGDRLRAILQDIIAMTRDGSVMLPKMSKVIEEARELLSADEVDPVKIASVIGRDPGLAGQVLAFANSAAFGGRTQIKSIMSAVLRLGTRRVGTLVEAAALTNLFPAPKPPLRDYFQEFWETHLTTAMAAHIIAEQIGACDPDEAYLLALFHNVGELFLLGVLDRMIEAQPEVSIKDSFEVMRSSHSLFGPAIIAKWNMASAFTEVARHRHDEVYHFNDDLNRWLHITNLAEHIALKNVKNPYSSGPKGPSEEESIKFLGINHEVLGILASKLEEKLALS